MPEGDTIYRTAVRLDAVMRGQTILESRARDPRLPAASLTGLRLTAIEPRGKHLLMHCSDGRVVHSHMGMTGAWHVYRPDELWRKPAGRAALVLVLPAAVCVCFSPKTLELLGPDAFRRHAQLRRLGPDLLAANWVPGPSLERFRRHAPTPIGEAVMNQSIVCGMGNVYKSEVLFLEGLHPWDRVGQLSDDRLRAMLQRARGLLQRNLTGYPRRTRPALDGRRLWVYGRHGAGCFRCAHPIRMRRQGEQGRTTYWCPQCQPALPPAEG